MVSFIVSFSFFLSFVSFFFCLKKQNRAQLYYHTFDRVYNISIVMVLVSYLKSKYSTSSFVKVIIIGLKPTSIPFRLLLTKRNPHQYLLVKNIDFAHYLWEKKERKNLANQNPFWSRGYVLKKDIKSVGQF